MGLVYSKAWWQSLRGKSANIPPRGYVLNPVAIMLAIMGSVIKILSFEVIVQ